MSEEKSEGTKLDPRTARAEANIIVSITKPIAEEALRKASAPGSALEKILPRFGDTAFTELGSQLLDKVRKEKPGLYGALVVREKAFAALVGAVYPSYIDFKEEHSEEVKMKALESAKNTTGVIVNGIVQKIEASEPARGAHPETQDFVAATKAVQREIEEGHFISADNTEAVVSLLGCTLASLEANRQMRNFNMELGFNLGDALEKQLKFDQSKE